MECSAVTAPVLAEIKKYTPWRAVKTKLGEIEECDWCKLVEAVIERENEVPLLNALIQWCNEHNYVSAPVSEMRKEALQLHASRIFDNPQWIGFIPLTQNIGQKY